MPSPVVAAMKEYLDQEAASGGYAAADKNAQELDGVYQSIANLLNASADEIAIAENATAAWQMAFYAQTFQPGDRILTAQVEYAANYVAFLQVARRTGAVIDVVPSDSTGALDVAALERMIDARARLIAITWVPTNGGLTNPAAEVGQVARAYRIPYLLDACQAVGQMPVDVKALSCDMLAATGRKFLRGPRGTGFLYMRRGFMRSVEPPMIDHFAAPWIAPDRYQLRDDARRFETWENNYAARIGLKTAVDYALSNGMKDICDRCKMLSQRLRDGLKTNKAIVVHDLGHHQNAIVSFNHLGMAAEQFVRNASGAGVTIGLSNPASTLLDARARSLPPVVRASPHYFNTESEIDQLIKHCAEVPAA